MLEMSAEKVHLLPDADAECGRADDGARSAASAALADSRALDLCIVSSWRIPESRSDGRLFPLYSLHDQIDVQ